MCCTSFGCMSRLENVGAWGLTSWCGGSAAVGVAEPAAPHPAHELCTDQDIPNMVEKLCARRA
jgi:hypothetical protein